MLSYSPSSHTLSSHRRAPRRTAWGHEPSRRGDDSRRRSYSNTGGMRSGAIGGPCALPSACQENHVKVVIRGRNKLSPTRQGSPKTETPDPLRRVLLRAKRRRRRFPPPKREIYAVSPFLRPCSIPTLPRATRAVHAE